MKSLGRLLTTALLLGNLLLLAALSVHVVESPAGKAIIAKSQLTLVDTVIDTRGWTAADLKERPLLVERIRTAGKSDLLGHIKTATASSESSSRAPERMATPEPHAKSIFDAPGQN
jgi:hypothetical protein